jgi:hypothetical protein
VIIKPATLLSFLGELRAANIDYRLNQVRDEAIMVEVAVPGERWEVEFVDDGTVEIEVFRSDGSIHDAAALNELLSKFSH